MISQTLVITPRYFIAFILVSYAVVLSPFVDTEQRNYLALIAAMIGGGLFIQLRLSHSNQASWAFILFSIMTLNALIINGIAHLGSVALTFTYATGYFAVASLMDLVTDKRIFIMMIMRRIIFAFTILSLLQLITSLLGFPIPNLMATKGLWSYNSLSHEPSQLGRVVGISMLCYIVMSRLPGEPEKTRVRNKLIIAFITAMILSGSSLATIAIFVVYWLSRPFPWFVFILIVGALLQPLFLILDFEVLQRFILLSSSFGSFELDQVLEADHSGGIRLAPFLIYIRDIIVTELGFWLGYGNEGIVYFFQGKISGVPLDYAGAGFLPGFAVVYGILAFALFVWIFVLRQNNWTTMPLIAFWLIFFTSSALNTQVFWYALIIIKVAWAASHDFTHPFKCTKS